MNIYSFGSKPILAAKGEYGHIVAQQQIIS